ncbi:MAG: hypothetical protein R3220_00635, partial [Balneolaceae bacterium]|nr:hypothetical protein [Balneolaceae bacterium]
MNNLNLKFISALLVVFVIGVACDTVTGDPELPIPLEETLENRGAFLRINSVNSAAFDLADLSTAAYSIDVEYFDGEDATLLDNVQFYASYQSFGLNPEDRTVIPETDQPVYTVPASQFSENERGLPATTITVPLTAVLEGLGLTTDDVGVEDRFTLRWVLNLTDGRTFSVEEASPAIGGGFYSSPYQAQVFTVQALAADQFVGSYMFDSQNAGVFGWETFSDVFTSDLIVDPDNSLNGRIFTAEPYAEDWGGLAPIDVPISLGRTATAAVGSAGVGTGLGCGVGLAVGPITDPAANGVIIDVSDDSEFTLVIS